MNSEGGATQYWINEEIPFVLHLMMGHKHTRFYKKSMLPLKFNPKGILMWSSGWNLAF